MRLELSGRHITITAALRTVVERRLDKLARTYRNGIVSAQVVLTRERSRCRAEATIHVRGDHFFHGNGVDQMPGAAIERALDKVERQALTLKGRMASRKRGGRQEAVAAAQNRPERAADREPQIRVVRARRYEVRPMTIDDAALAIGADATAFIVFRNASTDAVNVLFRRPDGHLGLIEPEE